MTAFDPYHVWLGIPPDEQPANYYRLLGLRAFESNADVIDHAADRQTAHLRSFSAGERAAVAQKLLNEVAAARVCLLDAKLRAEYDGRLRAEQAKAAAPAQPLPPTAGPSVRSAVMRPVAMPGGANVAASAGGTKAMAAESAAGVTVVATAQRGSRRMLPPLIVAGVAASLAIAAALVFRELQSREDAGSERGSKSVAAGSRDGQVSQPTAVNDRPSRETPVPPLLPPGAESVDKPPPVVAPRAVPTSPVPTSPVPPNETPAKQGTDEAPEQSTDPLTELLEGEIPSGDNMPADDMPADDMPADDMPSEGEPDEDERQGSFDPKAPVESLFGDFVKGGLQDRGIPERMPANRSPVPGEEILAAKEKEIRKLFAKELAQSKPQEVWEFARKLRGLAIETRNDDAARYALLTLAINQAIKAGDVETARAAANDLAMSFDVEWLDTVGRAVRDAARSGVPVAVRPVAIEHAADLARAAFSADELPLAKELTAEWSKLASAQRSAADTTEARMHRERIEAAEASWPEVEQALANLRAASDDAAASTTVGRYYCFVKGDWRRGVAYLARGNDATLRKPAEIEIKASPAREELVAAGDGWWAVAEKLEPPLKRSVQVHAIEWYARADKVLADGPEKTRVAKRLAESAFVDALPRDAAFVLNFEADSLSDRGGKLFVADRGPKKIVATVIGAKTGEGIAGRGMTFESASQFIDAASPAALRAPAALTVCAWVKPAPSGDGPGDIVSKDDWLGPARGFVLRNFRNAHLDFTVGNSDWNSVISPAPLVVGKWQHAAGSYDASEIRLYLDGKLVARKPLARPVVHSPWPLSIGRGTYAKDRGFVGAIDELAIFTRALGEGEIAELYRAGAAGLRLAK